MIFAETIYQLIMQEQKKGKPEDLTRRYDIPLEGSLGLMALGAAGIKIWRAAKKNARMETNDIKSQEPDAEA